MNKFKIYVLLFGLFFSQVAISQEDKQEFMLNISSIVEPSIIHGNIYLNSNSQDSAVSMQFFLRLGETSVCYTNGDKFQNNLEGKCVINYYSAYLQKKVKVTRLDLDNYSVSIDNENVNLQLVENLVPYQNKTNHYIITGMVKN